MADVIQKKQHNIEYIAIIALVILALSIGITRFKKTGSDDEVFTKKEFTKKWKEVEILDAKVLKKEKEISYSLSDERVPFKGPFDEEKKEEEVAAENVVLPAMEFQGMVWNGFRPQAIINNKVYDVNDTIGLGDEQVLVNGVSKDGISLKYKGKEFIVRPKQ